MIRLLTIEKQRGKEENQRETKKVLASVKGWKWSNPRELRIFTWWSFKMSGGKPCDHHSGTA